MTRYSELKRAVIILLYTKYLVIHTNIKRTKKCPYSVVSDTELEVITISASLIYIYKDVEVLRAD